MRRVRSFYKGMNDRILFSHPTGNSNARAALAGLINADILKEFHTTIALFPGNRWDLIAKCRPGSGFDRRKFDKRLRAVTVQHSLRELGRMLAERFRIRGLCRHETGFFSVDAVYGLQDRLVARRLRNAPGLFTGVYTYEDGAVETLTATKEQGIAGFYDLPIGYWRAGRRLLATEANIRPEWASTMTGLGDSAEKLERKDAELKLADRIFVASTFTSQTLQEF